MASEIANDTQTESYKLHCTGEENSLQKCMRVKSQNCNTNAGVKCKGQPNFYKISFKTVSRKVNPKILAYRLLK